MVLTSARLFTGGPACLLIATSRYVSLPTSLWVIPLYVSEKSFFELHPGLTWLLKIRSMDLWFCLQVYVPVRRLVGTLTTFLINTVTDLLCYKVNTSHSSWWETIINVRVLSYLRTPHGALSKRNVETCQNSNTKRIAGVKYNLFVSGNATVITWACFVSTV